MKSLFAPGDGKKLRKRKRCFRHESVNGVCVVSALSKRCFFNSPQELDRVASLSLSAKTTCEQQISDQNCIVHKHCVNQPLLFCVNQALLCADCAELFRRALDQATRKVDVRLPRKGNSNSHGARPVHLIISMIKWIRTIRL